VPASADGDERGKPTVSWAPAGKACGGSGFLATPAPHTREL